MLSQPNPPMLQSVAKHLVINSSHIVSGSRPFAMRRITKSVTSCFKGSLLLMLSDLQIANIILFQPNEINFHDVLT